MLEHWKPDYKIVNHLWFGRVAGKEDKGYICYRTIIAHAIYHAGEWDNTLREPTFQRLFDSWVKKQNFKHDSLELFWASNNDYGEPEALILIDKSKGCYPLVFYSDPKKSYSSRLEALQPVIDDLQNIKAKLFELFNSINSWDEAVNNRVTELFNYKS